MCKHLAAQQITSCAAGHKMHMVSSTQNPLRSIAAGVFVFAFCASRSICARSTYEEEWLDFEPQPAPTFTLGVPTITNPSLYDIRNNGRLSERVPNCRLIALNDCCDDVWTLQWWEYQQIMDAQRDHYVYLYRRDHQDQEPYQDPEIKHQEDFKLPMEAAATLAFPQEIDIFQPGAPEPSFTFRCVLTLRPNSLLRFVASKNFPSTSPKAARWTKPYRIFCLKDEEQPYTREVPSRRYIDPDTQLQEVTGPESKVIKHITRTGFCGPRDMLQSPSPRRNHQTAQVINHRSYP